MTLKLANNATGRLAIGISTSDTTVILQAGEGANFPALAAGDWFPLTVLRPDNTREIMYVTARAGDTLTVTRGKESSAPLAFLIGDRAEMRLTAGILAKFDAAIKMIGPRVGEIKQWHGAISDIATVHGPGWQLADGTNGTANLRDRFIVGAGSAYAVNATGGADTVALSTAQMPTHNHGVSDPGHGHGVSDPTHAHSVYDPGHAHSGSASGCTNVSSTGGGGFPTGYATNVGLTINAAGTGIGIYAAGTGISIVGAGTGISTQNNGSGGAHENRPPYYALAFIEYTGIGAVDPISMAA